MKKIIMIIVVLVLGFIAGSTWNTFWYNDMCLDMGGGKNPGGHEICILEVEIEKEADQTAYLCDKMGNKFISYEQAKSFGLDDAVFGATYCLNID